MQCARPLIFIYLLPIHTSILERPVLLRSFDRSCLLNLCMPRAVCWYDCTYYLDISALCDLVSDSVRDREFEREMFSWCSLVFISFYGKVYASGNWRDVELYTLLTTV